MPNQARVDLNPLRRVLPEAYTIYRTPYTLYSIQYMYTVYLFTQGRVEIERRLEGHQFTKLDKNIPVPQRLFFAAQQRIAIT
jgi:hypothetical protein